MYSLNIKGIFVTKQPVNDTLMKTFEGLMKLFRKMYLLKAYRKIMTTKCGKLFDYLPSDGNAAVANNDHRKRVPFNNKREQMSFTPFPLVVYFSICLFIYLFPLSQGAAAVATDGRRRNRLCSNNAIRF